MYWGDRITILVIICGTGAFFFFGTLKLVADGEPNLGPVPIVGPLLGGIMMILGVMTFFRPWPTRIEIDAKEVRVFHRPEKTVTLPRKIVIGAAYKSAVPGGGNYGILYTDEKGKRRAVNIYGGWRGDDGTTYLKLSIAKAINAVLGIKHIL